MKQRVIITVPRYTGNTGRKADRLADTVEEIEIEFDITAIAESLGRSAVLSKSGIAITAGNMIKVTHLRGTP
jgi:hypothetical protein